MSRSSSGAIAARGRLLELAANASMAVSTVVAHLGDDPLLLVVQGSRRLPRPVVTTATRLLLREARRGPCRPSVRAAYGAWLAGTPSVAADGVRALVADATAPPHGLRGRLLAELAVQLGQPELVPTALLAAGPSLRARAAWLHGDVRGAVGQSSRPGRPSAMAVRLASEVAMLQPGMRLSPPTGAPAAPRPTSAGARSVGPVLDMDVAVFHILTNSLPHTQSGYAVRSHSVLAAQRASGIRVEAATRLGYPVSIGALLARHRDTVDGITYRRTIPFRSARTAEARAQQQVDLLHPVVERWAPDVLHTTTNFANALVTRALAESLRLPWVYEVRGLLEETWVASRPAGAERVRAAASDRYALIRARETEMAHAADHVVTLSATLREELVARGVARSKITVVPNAVDAGLLGTATSPPEARCAVGLPREGFWVGTVSSLVDYEGLDTLIDAVHELRSRGLDARALVVGDGVSRPELEHRAAAAGLGANAVFTGRVARDRAPSYHQALDVFVVPRRNVRVCRRVTPLKPIEAMALGRPVVASDLPALAELVEPHGSGRLVPPGDAVALADVLEQLRDSPQDRERQSAAGRAFARTRTWDAAGAVYRTLYTSLVADAAG